MAEPQPSNVKEGATGEIEDEVQATAKSAEDRKAAAAMASMDARDDSAGGSGAGSASVDQEAVSKAMKNLGGGGGGGGAQEVNKKVKVDAADVALLVCRQFTPDMLNLLGFFCRRGEEESMHGTICTEDWFLHC